MPHYFAASKTNRTSETYGLHDLQDNIHNYHQIKMNVSLLSEFQDHCELWDPLHDHVRDLLHDHSRHTHDHCSTIHTLHDLVHQTCSIHYSMAPILNTKATTIIVSHATASTSTSTAWIVVSHV